MYAGFTATPAHAEYAANRAVASSGTDLWPNAAGPKND